VPGRRRECNSEGAAVSLSGEETVASPGGERSISRCCGDSQFGICEYDPVADAAPVAVVDFDGECGGIFEGDADWEWFIAAVDEFVEYDAFVDADDELCGILPGVAEGKGVIDSGEAVELFELLFEVPGDFGG
jgi:hypothetical protein